MLRHCIKERLFFSIYKSERSTSLLQVSTLKNTCVASRQSSSYSKTSQQAIQNFHHIPLTQEVDTSTGFSNTETLSKTCRSTTDTAHILRRKRIIRIGTCSSASRIRSTARILNLMWCRRHPLLSVSCVSITSPDDDAS